jgi:hypothetical protein
MPADDGLRPDDHYRFENRREPPIQQDEEQPIAIVELDPVEHLSLQHDHLVSKCGVLHLKSALRLERAVTNDQMKQTNAIMVRQG